MSALSSVSPRAAPGCLARSRSHPETTTLGEKAEQIPSRCHGTCVPKPQHSRILRGRFLGVLASYLSPRREVRTVSCLNPWLSASSTRLPLALCTRAACSGERISRGGGDGSGERVGLLRIQRLAREAYSKTTSHGLRPAGGYPEAVWAPGHATGRPKLRPAPANQPLGPRSPAIQALVSTWRENWACLVSTTA